MKKMFLFLLAGVLMLTSAFVAKDHSSQQLSSRPVVKIWTDSNISWSQADADNAVATKKADLITNGNTIISTRTWWEPAPPEGEGRCYFAEIKYNTGPPPSVVH